MDPQEALQKIKRRRENNNSAYKLILISQSLSIMHDGIELCKDIMSLNEQAPERQQKPYVSLMIQSKEMYD